MTDFGVQFDYLYHDNDLMELHVTAGNGRFQGDTQLYVGRDELSAVASDLIGFPASNPDTCELQLGDLGRTFLGGLRMTLTTTDMAGHVLLIASVKGNRRDSLPHYEECTVIGFVEPAAIDSFIPELRRIEVHLCGSALLRFADA